MARFYKGQIFDAASGATGHLQFSLRDDGTLAGNLRMGGVPREANTGIGGIWEGSEIRAGGANTVGGETPEDAVRLTVDVTGDILADGNVTGNIGYTWNFTPGQWNFVAKQTAQTEDTFEGTAGERAGMSQEELEAAQKKEAEAAAKKREEDEAAAGVWGTVKKYWEKTPTIVKIGGGLAIGEGLRRLWKRK